MPIVIPPDDPGDHGKGSSTTTVAGTVEITNDVGNPIPVSGTLTDAELRATPVPISGTVTVTDGAGPLTVDGSVTAIAQPGIDIGDVTVNNAAGAAAVNIQDGGNSITVDGPLTDAELRATPVPVSGTVTANAGTNLNTSLLSKESGGNLDAIAASLSVIDDWDESDRSKVNPIAGQAGVQGASGAVTALTQRVVLATDVGLPTGSNTIGKVDQGAGGSSAWATTNVPATTVGLSCYSGSSAASNNAAEIKSSAGKVYAIQAFNTNANPRYIKIYNKTGTPAPASDSASIAWRGIIPGNASGSGFTVIFPTGIALGTGIGISITASAGDSDNTSILANEVSFNVEYK